MSASTIEWTDATWNPVTGCSRVSPGCANCYIERTPPFRMQGRRFEMVGQESTTGVTLHPDRLAQPLRWRKPRRVFVCSLADLFHDEVPEHFIYDVFQAMHRAPQHTFQVLTKRPERLLAWYTDFRRGFIGGVDRFDECWPLPNVWLGVSIENARYTWRADVLREIPATVRFISAEPLLGSLFPPARLEPGTPQQPRDDDPGNLGSAASGNPSQTPSRDGASRSDGRGAGQVDKLGQAHASGRKPLDLTGIDWIIIGGESGPGARPFHLEHARDIIAACRYGDPLERFAAERLLQPGPAIFVKQLGASPLATWEVDGHPCSCRQFGIRDRKGGDITEWPADLQIREFPQ